MARTPNERAWLRAARSAARKNAKARAALPLLADQLDRHTAEQEYWHWRRNKARAGEDWLLARDGLQAFRTNAARRLALALLGEPAFTKLDTYCRRTFPAEQWCMWWQNVLAGRRVEFVRERVVDRQPGQPATRCTDWHEQCVLSKEEFDRRVPEIGEPSGGATEIVFRQRPG